MQSLPPSDSPEYREVAEPHLTPSENKHISDPMLMNEKLSVPAENDNVHEF